LCFTLETDQRLRVSGHVIREKFKSDEAAKASVLGLVDHAHTSTTELFEYSIVREHLTDERVGIRHRAAILGCVS
jgi:hypothetical protein